MTGRPESSDFSMFWMPDQVRHDELGTYYETIKLQNPKFECPPVKLLRRSFGVLAKAKVLYGGQIEIRNNNKNVKFELLHTIRIAYSQEKSSERSLF
jgi:hypothetical protein